MIRKHRLRALTLLSAIVASLPAVSCRRNADGDDKPSVRTVRLTQEWTPNANYAGAAFAKHEFAAHNGISIDIRPGSEEIDAVLEVVNGHSDFGDASADKILLANLKGADLVVIGTVSQYSPTCFLALRDSGIATPQDFRDKKVGVLTGTNTEKVYRLLLKKVGLPSPLPREVEAPFDLTSFINHQYDVRPAFIYDEPVTLRRRNIDFTTINPLDYGIKFVGTVYFCRAETIHSSRGTVQAFVNSVCDGWRAATRRPEEAIRLVKAYWNEVDADRELESLKAGMQCFVRSDDRLVRSVPDDWRVMVEGLASLGDAYKDVENINLSALIDNSFVDQYYGKVEP